MVTNPELRERGLALFTKLYGDGAGKHYARIWPIHAPTLQIFQ